MIESRLGVPARIQSSLDALLESLDAKAKGELVAVLAHGSAVRGGYDEATSDVDLVIVLTDDRLELLESLGESVALARTSARIESMILKQSELARAADVFPVLFDDLAQHSVVLRGTNPFTSITIHDDHRRLRIEQELREARIRLRVAIADASVGLLRPEGVVARKLRQVRSPLYALLRLAKNAPEKDDLRSVFGRAGEHLGIDVAPLLGFREEPRRALDVLVTLLDSAIARVDEHAGAISGATS